VSVDAASVTVRGLDCVDGTPLVDLKPARAA
jgi:tRNA (Thr-GGU) A37 N-methylase